MLKSAALYIVVVVSLVIGISCSSLILLGYYYRLDLIRYDLKEKLINNTNSAITLLLDPSMPAGTNKTIDLFGEDSDSVKLKNSFWGVYRLGSVTAFHNQESFSRSFFYGSPPRGKTACALYVTDYNRPLAVVGDAQIKGDAYLPAAGIKRAYINRRGFSGKKLVDGKIKKSDNVLIPLRKSARKQLFRSFRPNGTYQRMDFMEFPPGKALFRSFADTMLLISSNLPVLLNDSLSGNIMVYSSQQIQISSAAVLRDVLVVSPVIRVASGFRGNVQLFASDSITTGNNCRFSYPSALVLLKREDIHTIPYISLGAGSHFTGSVFALQNSAASYEAVVRVLPGAVLTGELYSEGYVDIQGTVKGCVICNKLLYKTYSSTYLNHLVDGKIDQTALPKVFVGSAFLNSGTKRKIIKWLE